MVRTFLDDFDNAHGEMTADLARQLHGTVATGRLFHPYLDECVMRLGLDLETVAVPSRFWGEGINVAGLLTGSDFVDGLKGNIRGDLLVLPSESMIGEEGLFLDDMTLADVERELDVRTVRSGYTADEFLETLLGL